MESITRRDLGKLIAAGAGVAVSAGLSDKLVPAKQAHAAPATKAAQDRECMLAVFTNSQRDGSDTIFMSADGYHFEKIADAFVDIDKNDPNSWQAVGSYEDGRSWPISTSSCPSIIWHDGYFWMLANQAQCDGSQRVRLMVTASRDLAHWSDPHELAVPTAGGWISNGNANQFDAVAADWAVDEHDTVWCVVSLGRYGAFHGQAQNDAMEPFLIKFNSLRGGGLDPTNNPLYVDCIDWSAQSAFKINLPNYVSDRIDGSLYFEGGKAYLSIKRNGVTNEIWSIDDLNRAGDANAWTLVCDNVVTGYEAPSLTKFNGVYYMFTDELADWTPDDHVRPPYNHTGTHYQRTTNLSGGWTSPVRIDAYDHNYRSMTVVSSDPDSCGPRHGTVITVTDPAALDVIWARRANDGWRDDQLLPRFADANHGDWFFDAVGYCANAGYMTGYSGTNNFGPNDALNRAQVATVMMRLFDPSAETGVLETNQTGMFDVGDRQWYTQACNWAFRNGVLNGYPNGAFGPLDQVERQQICTIVANCVSTFMGVDVSDYDISALESMPDADTVDAWFSDGVAWCLDSGVISGSILNGVAYVNPHGTLNRAQMATIIRNAVESGVITV